MDLCRREKISLYVMAASRAVTYTSRLADTFKPMFGSSLGTLRMVPGVFYSMVLTLYMSVYVCNHRYSISPSYHTPKLHSKTL